MYSPTKPNYYYKQVTITTTITKKKLFPSEILGRTIYQYNISVYKIIQCSFTEILLPVRELANF